MIRGWKDFLTRRMPVVVGMTIVVVIGIVALVVAITGNGRGSSTTTSTASPTPTGQGVEPTVQRGGNIPQNEATTTAIAERLQTPTNATPTFNVPTMIARATASADGGRKYVVDSGFRPVPHGFSFVNFGVKYPQEPGSLAIDEVRRMFGDSAVCATMLNGQCIPRKAALLWIDRINRGSRSGVCEGMVTESLRLFNSLDNAATFGSPTGSAIGLQVNGNDRLLHQIGYYFALQAVQPVAETTARTRQSMTPVDILDALIAALPGEAGGQMTLGIYQTGKGGHSVMPYAVEDAGNGLFRVYVYDPNFPLLEKYIEIDRNANTWRYSHDVADPSQDKSPWTGTATSKDMDLTTLAVRDQPLVCPWCVQKAGGGEIKGGESAAANNTAHNVNSGRYFTQLVAQSGPAQFATSQAQVPAKQLWLDSAAHALITDPQGKRLGFTNNAFVSEIPGAYSINLHTGLGIDQEPVYFLPPTDLDVLLDGQTLSNNANSSMAYFGAGMSVEISGISLGKGQQDHLIISDKEDKLVYKPTGNEKPLFKMAPVSTGPDYLVEVAGLEVNGGDTFTLTFDQTTRQLAVHSSDADPETYDLKIIRTDDSGSDEYTNLDINLNSGATEYIEVGNWDGDGPVDIGVDTNSDGSIDQTESEPDEDVQIPDESPTDVPGEPEVTETPDESTIAPDQTVVPDETVAPEETIIPDETVAPDETIVPDETVAPDETVVPDETVAPEETIIPDETVAPDETPQGPQTLEEPTALPDETPEEPSGAQVLPNDTTVGRY